MSIIKRNLQNLQSSLKANLTYIDIDFRGPKDPKDFIKHDGDALVNAYKIWLMSDMNEYCRRPGVGGFLRDNLNRYTFSPSSEQKIKDDLIAESSIVFPLIEIIKLEVTCVINKKYWLIKIAIRDKLTGLIGDLYTSGLVIDAI